MMSPAAPGSGVVDPSKKSGNAGKSTAVNRLQKVAEQVVKAPEVVRTPAKTPSDANLDPTLRIYQSNVTELKERFFINRGID